MSLVCDAWPVDTTCLPAGWATNPDDWTPLQKNSFVIAQRLLTRFTAGRVGLCTVKLRPCRRFCAMEQGWNFPVNSLGVGWVPMLIGGRVWNIGCGCGGPCGCGPVCEVKLQGRIGPDAAMVVKVDGVVIDPSEYFVQAPNLLVRRGGTGCWPECQHLDQPDTEPGTWSVTYKKGAKPQADAARAATQLAAELSAPCEKRACSLPKRVSSVVRNDVTYTLLDDLSIFDKGRTGIPEIDLWIASINPYGTRQGLKVSSPDLPQARRQVYP